MRILWRVMMSRGVIGRSITGGGVVSGGIFSKGWKGLVAGLVMLVGLCLSIMGENVLAYSSAEMNAIVSKAVFEGVYNCANGGAYKLTTIDVNMNTGWSLSDAGKGGIVVNNKSDTAVKLPYALVNIGADKSDNGLNCREVLFGENSKHSKFSKKGLIPSQYKTTGGTAGWTGANIKDNTKNNEGRFYEQLAFVTGGNYDGNGGIGWRAVKQQSGEFSYKLYAVNGFADKMVSGLSQKNDMGYSVEGYNGYDSLALNDNEIFKLYTYYLTSDDVYGMPVACEGQNDAEFSGLAEEGKILFTLGKGGKTCHIKAADAKDVDGDVYGVTSSGHFKSAYSLTPENIVERISGLENVDQATIEAFLSGETGALDELSSEDEENICRSAGLSGQAWDLCPKLANATATVGILDGMIESWLTVDTELYDVGTPTYEVWEIMRSVANVLMIVVLLVIIVSQLTGFLIDNYGIKKMLPKLVVMAIVVNLSFLICDVAVDLSNVMGVGLRDLFKSIGVQIAENASATQEVEGFIGWAIAHILALAAGIGAVAPVVIEVITAFLGAGGGVAGLIMAVVVLLLALLVILIALLIFFLMMGARMIIVILCIALSPLAFLLYVLPNTNSLFKKWWSLFKASLIIFPICGAVGGISYMVKAMVVSTNGIHLFMMIVAMLAPYLPFFILPTLLKESLSALGKVGAAITNMSSKLQSGARGVKDAVQNTNRFKENKREGERRMQDRRERRIKDRLQRRIENGEELNPRDTKRLARSTQIVNKLDREDREARALVARQQYADATLGDLGNRWEAAFISGNVDELDAMTDVINTRFGTSGASEIAARLNNINVVNGDNSGFANDNVRSSMERMQDIMMNNSSFAGNMKKKASDAYGMISNMGRDENGHYQNLAYFSANNQIATDLSDWSTQSGATLRRAIETNGLDADTVRELLTSDDPAIVSGIQSDAGKRNTMLEALYNREHGIDQNTVGPRVDRATAVNTYLGEHPEFRTVSRQERESTRMERESEQRQAMIDNLSEINRNLGGRRGGRGGRGRR